ncbi:MAG: thioredoxin domain-containing protein [Firmicutes bacterium]|nr:thioredoxin domain-containing protein [Bacillota bacterium]
MGGINVKTSAKQTNRLINEKSPYLLQHARNPVDWYPWGEEAFNRARDEDKLIFLSIGYSTCHWCHVMEKESFADPAVARLLNHDFVSIKLDREERPDLDNYFMGVCQMLTGQGGWPLTIIMTPYKKPFFAGTYFPRDSRHGLAGLLTLLPKLSQLWKEERSRVLESGEELCEMIREIHGTSADMGHELPGMDLLTDAFGKLAEIYDCHYGGFGHSPKFPLPQNLMFLLRFWRRSGEKKALDMVTGTLDFMIRGGIFDQLGFGFHRYSTDQEWLVPHFEKMLYDQALMALVYLEAYQVTADGRYSEAAGHILDYALRDLISPDGAFFAAEDADSDGEEGAFYVWTPAEIKRILGEERGCLFSAYYGVTAEGNFVHGKSVLHRRHEVEDFARRKAMNVDAMKAFLEDSRAQLLEGRSRRERPFRDEKIIAAWNGLIIAALAKAAVVLNDRSLARIATAAVRFIEQHMFTVEGRLLRCYRKGEAAVPAFLDDYAFLVWGLIELYQATFEAGHLRLALSLNEDMLDLFSGDDDGGLNFAADREEEFLYTKADAQDGALPSGNSVAALNLLKLGRLCREPRFEKRGESIIRAFSGDAGHSPTAFTFLLSALDLAHASPEDVIISGREDAAETSAFLEIVQSGFNPQRTVHLYRNENGGEQIRDLCPFLAGMECDGDPARAFVCHERRCLPPVKEASALRDLLQ